MAIEKVLTRQELYKLVWKKPMSKLAVEFGLSDQGLEKICRRHNIPKPGLGYWAKLQHGKEPPTPELPPNDKAELENIYFRSEKSNTSEEPLPLDYETDYTDILTKALSYQPPEKVTRYSEVISNYRKYVKGQYTNRYGFLEIGNREFKDVEIRLTKTTFQRGCFFLYIISDLFKSLGWALQQGTDKGYRGGALVVTNKTDSLRIKLKERVKQVKHKPTAKELAEAKKWNYQTYDKHDYIPQGILEFSIEQLRSYAGLKKKWADKGEVQLENILDQIAIGVARCFEYQKHERIEAEIRAEQWRKEEEIRAEKRRQAKVEEKRQQHILGLLDQYTKAQQLRAMISQVESVLIESEEHENWLNWAHSFVDKIDPLKDVESIPATYRAIDEETLHNAPYGGW